MTRPGSLATIIGLTVTMLAGCAGAAAPSASPTTITAAPTTGSIPGATPTPVAVHEPTPAEVAEAIKLRQQLGLRSDEAWVRAVAVNPDAVTDWGVPLLPFEADDLASRPTGDDTVTVAVQAYLAAHPDISGGVYIDQAHGGILTVLVTADPTIHEAAIRAQLGGPAPLVVRQVRWTEAELSHLQERISAEQAFIASIPARMTTSEVDIIGNRVELAISSAVPDAAARIASQVGAQPGQLVVTSDGTGLLLQPTGRILGHITAPAGVDVTRLSPQYEADVDIGVRDAVGIAVKPDGTFVIDDLPPTGYTITILELADAGNKVVGTGRAIVPPGGVATVEIPVAP